MNSESEYKLTLDHVNYIPPFGRSKWYINSVRSFCNTLFTKTLFFCPPLAPSSSLIIFLCTNLNSEFLDEIVRWCKVLFFFQETLIDMSNCIRVLPQYPFCPCALWFLDFTLCMIQTAEQGEWGGTSLGEVYLSEEERWQKDTLCTYMLCSPKGLLFVQIWAGWTVVDVTAFFNNV